MLPRWHRLTEVFDVVAVWLLLLLLLLLLLYMNRQQQRLLAAMSLFNEIGHQNSIFGGCPFSMKS